MRILAVTSARADWGLLAPVLALLRDDVRFDLRIAVTGQHLMTDRSSRAQIVADGFTIDHEIDMELGPDDSPRTLTRACGLVLAGLGSALEQDCPAMMLVLGDRYEVLCAAQAALLAGVPVAHLCGGDITHGAFDDSIRHAITKMSALHFVTNDDAARRVRQLGEDPTHVFVSGSTGIDHILAQPIIDRNEFLAEVGLPTNQDFILVSFHPETLASDPGSQLSALLAALEARPETGLLLSGSNADPGGRAIDHAFTALAEARENAVFYSSLGSRLYFSAMAHTKLMLGNSSSGLYEAPSFSIPTVNIGDRQAGRPRARSVIDCIPAADAIGQAIERALSLDCSGVENPFGDGLSAPFIVKTLAQIDRPADLRKKIFKDITN